jgi:uncharacterized protein
VIDALLLLLTLGLGAVLARVSLCAVAAVQQAVAARSFLGLERILLAASGAGVLLLLSAGIAPDRVWLPAALPLRAGIIAGGVLLGVGSLLNGACYLGSVLYLGSGNLNFLLTLAGIGIGARAAAALALSPEAPAPMVRMAQGHGWIAGAGVFLLAIVLVLALRRWRSREHWLALGAGALGGLVCARHPGWTYGAVLETLARARGPAIDWGANLSAMMLFAGALAGAGLAGRFRLQRPSLLRGSRCLLGGAVMGVGAALVPGGNDNLLLWAIPGLTAYGVLAYLAMLATIGLGLALGLRLRLPGAVGAGPPK